MFADLMAEMPPGERYADSARGWLDGVLTDLFPELREGLRTRPSTQVVSKRWDDGPEGEPGQVRGEIEFGVTARRSRTVLFTEAAWSRFLGSLSKSPVTASLNVRVVDEDGYLSDEGVDVGVARSEMEPEWVRFTFWAPTWSGSAELQDRWAGAVRGQAVRIGACAGMITTQIGGPVRLDEVIYPDWPPEMVVQPPEYVQEVAMLGVGRDVLYRYSWVTIIPPGLARRLGGAAALTASGAFFEVSELSGGSVWLRATRTIEEFDESRSAAVATALAPVLVSAGVL